MDNLLDKGLEAPASDQARAQDLLEELLALGQTEGWRYLAGRLRDHQRQVQRDLLAAEDSQSLWRLQGALREIQVFRRLLSSSIRQFQFQTGNEERGIPRAVTYLEED